MSGDCLISSLGRLRSNSFASSPYVDMLLSGVVIVGVCALMFSVWGAIVGDIVSVFCCRCGGGSEVPVYWLGYLLVVVLSSAGGGRLYMGGCWCGCWSSRWLVDICSVAGCLLARCWCFGVLGGGGVNPGGGCGGGGRGRGEKYVDVDEIKK